MLPTDTTRCVRGCIHDLEGSSTVISSPALRTLPLAAAGLLDGRRPWPPLPRDGRASHSTYADLGRREGRTGHVPVAAQWSTRTPVTPVSGIRVTLRDVVSLDVLASDRTNSERALPYGRPARGRVRASSSPASSAGLRDRLPRLRSWRRPDLGRGLLVRDRPRRRGPAREALSLVPRPSRVLWMTISVARRRADNLGG